MRHQWYSPGSPSNFLPVPGATATYTMPEEAFGNAYGNELFPRHVQPSQACDDLSFGAERSWCRHDPLSLKTNSVVH